MLKNVRSLELSSALSETYAVGIDDVGALGFSAEERDDGAGDAVSLSAAILLGVEVITGSLDLVTGMGCCFLIVQRLCRKLLFVDQIDVVEDWRPR